jgi:hypothetical protein
MVDRPYFFTVQKSDEFIRHSCFFKLARI